MNTEKWDNLEEKLFRKRIRDLHNPTIPEPIREDSEQYKQAVDEVKLIDELAEYWEN